MLKIKAGDTVKDKEMPLIPMKVLEVKDNNVITKEERGFIIKYTLKEAESYLTIIQK